MRRCVLWFAAGMMILASIALARQNVPDLPFDSIPDFFKLPVGMNFGKVPGVAVDSKGNIYVFTRSNTAGGPAYGPAAAQLLEFSRKGDFCAKSAKGFMQFDWTQGPARRLTNPESSERTATRARRIACS